MRPINLKQNVLGLQERVADFSVFLLKFVKIKIFFKVKLGRLYIIKYKASAKVKINTTKVLEIRRFE